MYTSPKTKIAKTRKKLIEKVCHTDFAPVILALCDLVAGRRRRLFGVWISGPSPSSTSAFAIASKLEHVGADIEELLVLYVGGLNGYSSTIFAYAF
jgi:hypothetical protein